jgi:hypothetical protein
MRTVSFAFGGKLMRTVSFFGWTFEASAGFGGTGVSSDIYLVGGLVWKT